MKYIHTYILLNDRSTVPATTKEATFPVKIYQQIHYDAKPPLISSKSKQILLPGDSIAVQTNITDQQVLAKGWKSSQ